MNLNNALENVVAEFPESIAFKHPTGEVSYRMFHEAVKRLARGLQKLGVTQGEKVAIMLPNIPHFPIAYYATLRLGAVVVPVNTLHKGREVAGQIEDCEARVLIAWDGVIDDLTRPLSMISSLKYILVLGDNLPPNVLSLTKLIASSHPMAETAEIDDEDTAVIQYTAGVTGVPKGVELSHANLMSNVNACRDVMRVTKKDVFLGVLPFFLPMGQTLIMHLALMSGAELELHPRFEPEALLDSIIKGRSTVFVGVPSMYILLLEAFGKQETTIERHLRLCICGGGGIPDEVLKVFEKTFQTYILETYTTVETSPVVSFNQWRTGRRVGSLGHPIPGVDMRVVDENGNEVSIGEIGEIVVKGNNVMKGYVNRPRTTSEVLRDGWFHTGDLGKMDINGFFYLVDRLNDRIVKGGFSIYPTEVEAVMYGHPDVLEVAVVPISDELMGQEVKACVVLHEGASVTTEQLAEYCRQRIALYKVPAVIRFYQDLPRTLSGRTDKRSLRNLL